MKKSDKKIENALRQGLTQVCDLALDHIEGFVWITHLVNFQSFPSSLRIVCVFDSEQSKAQALAAQSDTQLCQWIQDKLNKHGIQIKSIRQHVHFDSQEACDKSHSGNWAARLARQ